MFRDTGVVKAPDDKMDALESSSGGGSSLNEGRRPRSGSANQDPQQALKCPRCDSTNTKFCYYNNYSTTQPRHFCKSCRRYWTRGGALRNVPVGGGCRKNKRVKQRLMGGVDPEESTSTMLARLNSCTFPSFGCPPNFGDDSGALLNMAAFSSRLQDSMRLRQQQSSDNSTGTAADDHHASNFFDMGFPAALMNKTCSAGACGGTCGSRTCAGINDTCGGLMNAFENNLNASMGYTTLPVKLEHEAIPYNTNYDLNTCLIDHTRMAGTSATATLASIEDQLSNFSNVPPVDSFNPDQMKVQEQKNFAEQKLPLQLLNHGGPQDSSDHGGLVIADFPLEEKVIMGDKPLINVIGPSLMSAENWQQSVLMNDVLFEPPHNLWGHSRWQDMHALATTTAAGGVL